jgi:hypothetical protein
MIGNYNWGIKTQGNMGIIAKIYFAYQAIKAKNNSKTKFTSTFKYQESDVKLPDSILVKQTIEFLKDTHQDFLINHCYRTYVFGNVIGTNESILFDKELFAVASLLHDVGLTNKHQFKHSNCNCFAIEGSIEAGLFLDKQNIEKDKIKIIQNAISLHLNIKIPSSLPEAYLLNKGAGVDVIGQNLAMFDAEFIEKTIAEYPRLNFKSEIHQLMKEQCKLRPQSRISFLYRNGFPTLIKKSKFDE